jgi:hypothetical protein
MVAATLRPVTSTYCTASRVVTCSSTTFRALKRSTIGPSTSSTKAFSRSNTSTAGSVTSPWIKSGRPSCSIFSSAWKQREMRVTPSLELVVAPAG